MEEKINLYTPYNRPRRLRRGNLLRKALQDVYVSPSNLIMPLFLVEGSGVKNPISSMPGIFQLSPDLAIKEIKLLLEKGLSQFLLFGVIERHKKDSLGTPAFMEDNPVNLTLKMVRDQNLDCIIYTDLCFCEYTDHGHCGPISKDPLVTVDNDQTLEYLCQQAVLHAQFGADFVAPSGMMDGIVGSLRHCLDTEGFTDVGILSYSVKYASALYGPFREAADGAPQFGDRKSYQMDYRRSQEWAQEIELDIEEGADMLMVKPAIAYLDIIKQIKQNSNLPLAAYQVSGEFSMIHAAAEKGWLDLKATALETTYAIKRAGADLIISYFSPELCQWLD